MRETIKPQASYTKLIAEIDQVTADLKAMPDEHPDNFPRTMRLAFFGQTNQQMKLTAMYSRGDAVGAILNFYPQVLDNFSALVKVAAKDVPYVRDQYGFGLDKYYRLVAWAVLFEDTPFERRRAFVEDLDFFGAQKPGEIMLRRAGLIDREPIARLNGKPAYEPLLAALEAADPAQQEAHLKTFLSGWYKALKKMNVAWIDDHKSKHDVHFGCWCFEAAAAVKVLGLDPEAFKSVAYFPYDLVATGRSA